MPADRVVVRAVAWRDLCPWLVIFRTFGLATSMPMLFLATVGALLTPIGWKVGATLFLKPPVYSGQDDFRFVQGTQRWPGQRGAFPPPNEARFPKSVQDILFTTPDVVQPVFRRFVEPVAELFEARLSVTRAAYYVCGLLWTLAVWGFFGGALTRMAAVKLGREERIGLREALRHAARRFHSYVASPIFPLLGVAAIAIPIYLLGLLMAWDWGVLVAGILWVIVLLGGLTITILLLGLLFGWPLMWVTVSSEETGDAFEAFSRTYSYIFGRPLHYLFYAVLAVLFGGLSWLLVYHFSEAVIRFCDWPAELGAGAARWNEILRSRENPSLGVGSMAIGAILMNGCVSLVRSVATGFGYSLFWCLATAIYLLLRQDVDQTELDEVYVENENKRYELPALTPQPPSPSASPTEPTSSAPASSPAQPGEVLQS